MKEWRRSPTSPLSFKKLVFMGFRVGAAHYSIWGGAYFGSFCLSIMNIGSAAGIASRLSLKTLVFIFSSYGNI
jgi:hypothetical protein